MTESTKGTPLAIAAMAVPARNKPSSYPEPFASRMTKREKRILGGQFGLSAIGVNLTRLAPGGESALLHVHTKLDEFIYILEGSPTLVTDRGEVPLAPGMCAGFPASGVAHHLVNRTHEDVLYLEISDKAPGDEGIYPADDLRASLVGGEWVYSHKDGRPY